MELTPANSPKYGITDIKKQNALWRKRVRQHAKTLSDEGLKEFIRQTKDIIDSTESLPTALTEKARLKELERVLTDRRK